MGQAGLCYFSSLMAATMRFANAWLNARCPFKIKLSVEGCICRRAATRYARPLSRANAARRSESVRGVDPSDASIMMLTIMMFTKRV